MKWTRWILTALTCASVATAQLQSVTTEAYGTGCNAPSPSMLPAGYPTPTVPTLSAQLCPAIPNGVLAQVDVGAGGAAGLAPTLWILGHPTLLPVALSQLGPQCSLLVHPFGTYSGGGSLEIPASLALPFTFELQALTVIGQPGNQTISLSNALTVTLN